MRFALHTSRTLRSFERTVAPAFESIHHERRSWLSRVHAGGSVLEGPSHVSTEEGSAWAFTTSGHKGGNAMSRAATIPIIARLQTGLPGAVAACVRVWGRGSLMAVLLTLSLALLGEGAPGDLDPTFGVGGIVTTDLGGFDAASAPILQPDGKLVALGISSSGETS